MDTQHDASPVTPTPHQRAVGVDRPFSLHPPGMGTGPGSSHPYRFADFDDESFSEQSGISAEQAKRALRAHLAETERRMAEAGRLGTALVQQQKDLTDKLREVEDLQAESELSPELKKKLAELEKDYDDVARETARAFLPKQRIPSNESAGSPEPRSGRRSISPVKYESHASGSPTKLSVSNRKQRNQANNRVHDIEFAAEISTSLISQVRGLQALLAERDEELRDTRQELAQLEDTTENLRERIKDLDESEHRFKEENWNLETRVHDLEAAQRDAADREKKVAQQLAALQADKAKSQRDLDELKGTHARLVDDHAAAIKQHDIELGTAKRNMVMADSEKSTLQRKVDDLASQNQELARAVSMQYRGRSGGGESLATTSDDEADSATDQGTPEHSPPASPVKGTPRHSVLESETLKTSLLHAQRTLQSLRTNLHREKTEKLELRRLLQDARDDLEKTRADPNNNSTAGPSKKSRKENRDMQKLRSSQLGGARSSRTELFTLPSNDPDWEEIQGEPSPSATRSRAGLVESSDQFDTANEGPQSDTEYATANDGAETTEDFHTGAEELSSGEDTMTETEQDTLRRRALRSRSVMSTGSVIRSVETDDLDPANQSTASTSDDEFQSPRTPTAVLPSTGGISRMRLRLSRSSLASRRLRHMNSIEDVGSSPIGLQSSPFSATASPAGMGLAHNSANSTPRVQGQSLFAELGDLGEDSDEEVASDGTPIRRRSPRSMTPSVVAGTSSSSGRSQIYSPLAQPLPARKPLMVDSSTITDAVTILPRSENEEQGQRLLVESRPTSFLSDTSSVAQSEIDVGEKLKEFPTPPTSVPGRGLFLPPIKLPPPHSYKDASAETRELQTASMPLLTFKVSGLFSIPLEPVAEVASPVDLTFSSLVSEHVTPKSPPAPEPEPAPTFSTSSLQAVAITPIESPAPQPLPVLSTSPVQAVTVSPIESPAPQPQPLPVFSTSLLQSVTVAPIESPTPEPKPLPVFSTSSLQAVNVTPIEMPPTVIPVPAVPREQPAFSFSSVQAQHVVPVEPREPTPAPVEPFSFSRVQVQHVVPTPEPEKKAPPPPQFSLSAVHGEEVEPRASPKKPLPSMAFSNVFSQDVEPIVVEEQIKEEPALPALVNSTATQTDEWKSQSAFGGAAALAAAAALGAAALTHGNVDDRGQRSPKRNAFIIPRDVDDIETVEALPTSQQPTTPNKAPLDSLLGGWSRHNDPPTPVIAEDETRQSPSTSPFSETPESLRPFKEISVNEQRPVADDQNTVPTLAPTDVAVGDDEFDTTPRAVGKSSKPVMADISERQHSRSESQESTGSVRRIKLGDITRAELGAVNLAAVRRPGSAASTRTPADFRMPPLPANHKEVIEAARTGSFSSITADHNVASTTGAGLPSWGIQTPTTTNFPGQTGTPTPKAVNRTVADLRPPSRPASRTNANNVGGSAVLRPPTISRQTSMSSFASEVDARFNIHDGSDVFGNSSHTDPRMIQAITQTMIGEYLWKYTRKPGRSGFSENRHRRYFWIHPYTRMLYWSSEGPTTGSRAEHRAKSVVIEGVRVVTDDNPMPPGLHRKSLVVISPGRTIKFTCTTGHRHEIWFNALSYLLLRNEEVAEDDGMMATNGDHITREDVEEFNPSFGPRPTAPPRTRRHPPVSLSSYNSRTTRTDSPAFDMSMNPPTLTPTPKKNKSGLMGASATPTSTAGVGLSSRSRLGRIGGYWRSSQSLSAQFNSFRGHRHSGGAAQDESIYQASEVNEVNDSAEELRVLYEDQDRESGRLENVRACCDGKHDVGTLSHSARRHRHSHPTTASAMSTPTHGTARRRH